MYLAPGVDPIKIWALFNFTNEFWTLFILIRFDKGVRKTFYIKYIEIFYNKSYGNYSKRKKI